MDPITEPTSVKADKYEFRCHSSGVVEVLRGGEPWLVDMAAQAGGKALISLVHQAAHAAKQRDAALAFLDEQAQCDCVVRCGSGGAESGGPEPICYSVHAERAARRIRAMEMA